MLSKAESSRQDSPTHASWSSLYDSLVAGAVLDAERLLANLPFAVYLCDHQGIITAYNDAAVDIWGRSPEVGVERWCGGHRVLDADAVPMDLESSPVAQTMRAGKAVDAVEVIIERPNGERRNVLSHPLPLFDLTGKLTGAMNILVDVTERRREVITQALLAAIVESSDDAIVSKDLTGTITSWNKGAEKVFGYTADEAVGQNILMLIPPERHQEERDILSSLVAGRRIDHFQTVRRAKDGRYLDISLTVSPIRNHAGVVVGASKVARDVTVQKKHAITQKLLAAIVESSDDAIISKNLDGIITSWNRGAQEIFGYTADETVGQSIYMLIPEERHDEERGILARLVKGERIDHFETRRRRRDGELIDVSLTVSPILDDSGTIVGASKVARDITEQKRAQELLLRAKLELEQRVVERTEALRALAIELSRTEQRERKRLAQALHDDIQQLLVAVKIHASMIPQSEATANAAGEVIKLSDQAISACRSLVIGLSPPMLSDSDLPGALSWLARRMREQHGLEVQVSVVNCPPQLPEDLRLLLFEIVRELLFNVVKHSGVHAAKVDLDCSDDILSLRISDEGKGCEPMAAQEVNHGGFGLFSIRERLTGLGGRFTVLSSPGEGCRMLVQLPLPQ